MALLRAGHRLKTSWWLTTLVVALGAGVAHAESLTVHFVPARVPKTRMALFRQLAEIGAPQQVTVPIGRTLDQVLIERCGFAADDLVSFVRSQNQGFNPAASDTERAIQLFPCPFWEGPKSIVVPAGVKKLSKVLQDNIGQSGPDTTRRVVGLNPGLRQSKLAVLPGQTIKLPFASVAITFALAPPYDADPPKAQRLLENKFQSLIVQAPKAATEIDLVTDVQPAESEGSDEACDEEASNVPWPFDRARVFEIVTDNLNRHVVASERNVTIVVGDTGIDAGDIGLLPLREVTEERGAYESNGKDEGGNGFKDDRWGARMDPPGGFPQSADGYERRDHGTQVAALIVGGLLDDPLTATVKDRLRLAIADVVSDDRRPGQAAKWTITENAVNSSLRYASVVHARLVNWSIESWHPMGNVEDAIRTHPELLIVAAAGNLSTDLNFSGSYPASYIRTYPDQIITVAALSRNLKLAEFSNYGGEVVDIGAPGCGLDTMSRGGVRRKVKGTSFAAPVVTFTAAMLAVEGMDRPAEIKRRIIHTATVDPELNQIVQSSGRLDVAKALAIADDVVETTTPTGERTMMRGRVLDPEAAWEMCDDTLSRDDIVRIMPQFTPGAATPTRVWLRTYDTNAGKMVGIVSRDCPLPAFDLKFEERSMAPDGAVTVTPARAVPMGSITDFVPRLIEGD